MNLDKQQKRADALNRALASPRFTIDRWGFMHYQTGPTASGAPRIDEVPIDMRPVLEEIADHIMGEGDVTTPTHCDECLEYRGLSRPDEGVCAKLGKTVMSFGGIPCEAFDPVRTTRTTSYDPLDVYRLAWKKAHPEHRECIIGRVLDDADATQRSFERAKKRGLHKLAARIARYNHAAMGAALALGWDGKSMEADGCRAER